MMELDLEHAETVSLALGQEFLTWLWFASETQNGLFRTADGEVFSLLVEQKVSVQGGEGETAAELSVPLDVSLGRGRTWRDAAH